MLHSIFQEAYIIWSRFLVRKCKMMRYPDASFIFSKFWFSGFFRVGVKGQQMTKMSFSLRISGTVPHVIVVLVHMDKMMIYLAIFSIFSKFWFFQLTGFYMRATLALNGLMSVFVLHILIPYSFRILTVELLIIDRILSWYVYRKIYSWSMQVTQSNTAMRMIFVT